jgi:hypothetical protein
MSLITLHFSIDIRAPKDMVWRTMFADSTYREWTSAFSPGSYFEGSWALGSKILFLGPDPDGKGGNGGMVSRIAESRLHEYVGIEHLGMVSNGVEDTQSDGVKDWAGARENYSFSESSGVTTLRVEMQTAPTYEAMFNDSWPKALKKLKALSESALS